MLKIGGLHNQRLDANELRVLGTINHLQTLVLDQVPFSLQQSELTLPPFLETFHVTFADLQQIIPILTAVKKLTCLESLSLLDQKDKGYVSVAGTVSVGAFVDLPASLQSLYVRDRQVCASVKEVQMLLELFKDKTTGGLYFTSPPANTQN